VIIWLASYPRSGNTFLRAVLHAVYGLPTYSVYEDNDPVAQRVGPGLVGYQPKPKDRVRMADSDDVFFVKTHKRRKADGHRAIYLVRDGRDAVVSHARLRASLEDPSGKRPFEEFLRAEVVRPYDGQPSSGTWGGNVLSWLDGASAPVGIVRYEQLIVDPVSAAMAAVSLLVPALVPTTDAAIPGFADLHAIDPTFFRRGVVGSHADEMPAELHDLFWAQPENAAAMQLLGYRDGLLA